MADEPETIGSQEIEDLLKQANDAVQPGPAASTKADEPVQDAAVRQDEIDSLLRSVGAPANSAGNTQLAVAPASTNQPVSTRPGEAELSAAPPGAAPHDNSAGNDVQFLLDQAEQALASVDQPVRGEEGGAAFQFRDLTGSAPTEEKATLDLIRDVEMDVKIELGRTNMFLEEVLKLRRGTVVALDKLAGDPVDVYVNGRLIARGEVLVLNDNFCVRVAELIAGDDAD